jgi:chromosome segregation ATPase
MRNIARSAAGAALALLLVPMLAAADGAPPKAKTLYRWVDANGNVHFSDVLPADAAKEERQVIDQYGDVRRIMPRQKTDAELQQEREQARQARQQADYDQSLLKTYPTIDDLKRAGNDRIETLDGQIQQMQKMVNDSQDRVADLRSKIASAQAGGEAAPDPDLQRQLDQYETALQHNRENLAQLRQDRQRAEDQYIRDVERYRQLKQGTGMAPKN